MCSANDDPTTYDAPTPQAPRVYRLSGDGRYEIAYTVAADTELAAINTAVGMLRTAVRLISVVSATRATPVHWRVVMRVSEDAA